MAAVVQIASGFMMPSELALDAEDVPALWCGRSRRLQKVLDLGPSHSQTTLTGTVVGLFVWLSAELFAGGPAGYVERPELQRENSLSKTQSFIGAVKAESAKLGAAQRGVAIGVGTVFGSGASRVSCLPVVLDDESDRPCRMRCSSRRWWRMARRPGGTRPKVSGCRHSSRSAPFSADVPF